MMLPSALVALLEVELPLMLASSLLTKDEMIDCADAPLVDDVVLAADDAPDVAVELDVAAVPVVAEVLAVRLLSRF